MLTEHIEQLVTYNAWANGRVLRRLGSLSDEQWDEPCSLSGGTLRRTLLHVLDVQWSWRRTAEEGAIPLDYLTPEQFSSFAALRAFWREEDARLVAFVATLDDARLAATVTYSWPRARPRVRPLWQLLVHIVTHGVHHRAEIGLRLGELGRSPGDLDFLKYVTKREEGEV